MRFDKYECGIYWIKNVTNNKLYIGSAKKFKKRFQKHKRELRQNKHPNKHLQSAFNLVGENNFEFKRLLICEPKDLIMYEQLFMDFYKPYEPSLGYNIRRYAESNIGIPSPNKGKKLTEQAKQHLREINLGKSPSVETRKLLSISSKGRRHTDNSKMKISQGNKNKTLGRKMTEEDLHKRTKSWFINKSIAISQGKTYGRKTPTQKEVDRTNKKKAITNITKKLQSRKQITTLEMRQIQDSLQNSNFNV